MWDTRRLLHGMNMSALRISINLKYNNKIHNVCNVKQLLQWVLNTVCTVYSIMRIRATANNTQKVSLVATAKNCELKLGSVMKNGNKSNTLMAMLMHYGFLKLCSRKTVQTFNGVYSIMSKFTFVRKWFKHNIYFARKTVLMASFTAI